jgi:RimJ/RimL family protein N-acetyltransferase
MIEADDLPLYEQINCDPRMWEHLGGPLAKEDQEDKLRRDLATIGAGTAWILKIIPHEGTGDPAGTVAVWEHEWEGRRIAEIGWMVLPRFQGRGIGSQAVRATVDRLRLEGRWTAVHAFPPVANTRSNAMCRTIGFENLGECDFEYRGQVLRCNHWVLDLRAASSA